MKFAEMSESVEPRWMKTTGHRITKFKRLNDLSRKKRNILVLLEFYSCLKKQSLKYILVYIIQLTFSRFSLILNQQAYQRF